MLGKTVRQLTEEMDSKELSEWMAFDRIEPFDNPYWRSGMLAATTANVMGGGKNKPQDFMPMRRKPQTAAQQIAMLKALTSKEQK